MKDLSPELEASVKSLKEAAEMVNNPYQTAEQSIKSNDEVEKLNDNKDEKQVK